MQAPFGEFERDRVMCLRAGSVMTNKKEVIRKIAPGQTTGFRPRVARSHGDEKRFRPEWLRMAIGHVCYRRDEGNVQGPLTNVKNCVASTAIEQFQLNARRLLPVMTQ